jgi:hypothetical protein
LEHRLVGACVALAIATGCSDGKRVPAVGPGFEIIVLASPEARQFGERVAEILSEEIWIVQTEPRFRVVADAIDQTSFYDTRKLLFFVGAESDPDLEKTLRRATGTRTPSSVPGLWIEVEPFAAGQVAFILTGTVDSMSRVVTQQADDIVRVVEDAAVTRAPGERCSLDGDGAYGFLRSGSWTIDSPTMRSFACGKTDPCSRSRWRGRRDASIARRSSGSSIGARWWLASTTATKS